jgi:NADP-dependent 3-hydroxy acid dehydrogenase YdfG
MQRVEGRVAVVTGAASGIGRETAKLLARRGCRVAIADVDEAGLDELARELGEAGRPCTRHVVDVADRERMAAFADEVVSEHGAVHILVNNAGVALGDSLEELSWADLDWLIGINFRGVVHGCKFFLPHLRAQDEAHIVNLSSMFGFGGLPSQGPYCASKAAVRSISETLYGELAGSKVGITSVHPGGVRTNIVNNARFRVSQGRDRAAEIFERRGKPPEEVATRIVRAIERNQLRLVICPEAHVFDWAKRLLPVTTQRLVRRLWPRLDPKSETSAL